MDKHSGSTFVQDMERENTMSGSTTSTKGDKPKLPGNVAEGFPRYQLSKFLAGSKDYQIVVRANSQEEFIGAMEEIKPFISALEGGLQTTKSAVTPQNDVMARQHSTESNICPLHDVVMQEKNGAYGPYFSHMIQDVGFCNGKKITPFKQKTY